MLENAQNFKKDGFLISKPIVAENEIKSVRLELDNEFLQFDRGKGSTLSIVDIKDTKLVKKIMLIYKIQ